MPRREEYDDYEYGEAFQWKKDEPYVYPTIHIHPADLADSIERAQNGWKQYRADIATQIEKCYAADANEPDAEEIAGLDYWNQNSRLIVLAYQVGLRELLNMNRARELFESGKGTLISPKN